MSTLFFHQAALGDFVLTLPLLRALKGRVTVVSGWSRAALAAQLVEHVTPMDAELWEFTRLWTEKGPTSLSPAIRELFEQAELIISFVSRGDDHWAAHVRRIAPRAKIAFVEPRPPAGSTEHVTKWHERELRRQGVALVGVAPPPRSPRPGPWVVHAGSGGVAKCWPTERFEALIGALREAGYAVTPTLGEAEAERWPAETLDRWRDVLGGRVLLSLDELRGLLEEAAGYVGNDSGPTHLAAQLGVPTVALFGPSDARVWAPVGPAVTVLAPPQPRPMTWLDVDRVVAACGVSR